MTRGELADLAERVWLMGRRVDELYELYGAMWHAIEQMAGIELRKLKPGEYDVDIARLQEQVSVLMDRQNEFREQLAALGPSPTNMQMAQRVRGLDHRVKRLSAQVEILIADKNQRLIDSKRPPGRETNLEDRRFREVKRAL